MSGSATFTTVMSSRSMKVAVQTAIRVHHLRSRAGIRGVYRPGVLARTMRCDRRISPHHRNRRPHPAVGRLLRGRRRREGGPGGAQRDREVVLHLGAGGGDLAAAAPPGQRPPPRVVRVPAAGAGAGRPRARADRLLPHPLGPRPRRPRRRAGHGPRRHGRRADRGEHRAVHGPAGAVPVQRWLRGRIGHGPPGRRPRPPAGAPPGGHRLALRRPTPSRRPHARALPGARPDDPRRADEPPRPLRQALAAR